MKKVFGAKGVTVIVTTVAKERYLVEIQVLKESLEKEMRVKNSNFYFKMKTTKVLEEEPIRIQLKNEYDIDSQGNITGINNATKLKFSGDGYKGSIVLYPKAYIPKGIRKKFKSDDGYSKIKIVEEVKKPSSKYVNYSHNNANKPYVGGRVSPK